MSLCATVDFDICDCDCHKNLDIVHCTPCCYTCPYCGQNIVKHSYDSHVKQCKAETVAVPDIMQVWGPM